MHFADGDPTGPHGKWQVDALLSLHVAREIYLRLPTWVLNEVTSDCFRRARFQPDGSLFCACQNAGIAGQRRRDRAWNATPLSYCAEEFVCEAMAGCILIPERHFLRALAHPLTIEDAAEYYQIEPWVVVFRYIQLVALGRHQEA